MANMTELQIKLMEVMREHGNTIGYKGVFSALSEHMGNPDGLLEALKGLGEASFDRMEGPEFTLGIMNSPIISLSIPVNERPDMTIEVHMNELYWLHLEGGLYSSKKSAMDRAGK